MVASVPQSLATFPRGHEFANASFVLDEERLRAYLAATGDTNDYGGAVPPLAALALALEALQHEVSLPEGSLHTGQEVEHRSTLVTGETLHLTGRLAQRSERQGYAICVLELEISGSSGVGIRARSTIMTPLAGTDA